MRRKKWSRRTLWARYRPCWTPPEKRSIKFAERIHGTGESLAEAIVATEAKKQVIEQAKVVKLSCVIDKREIRIAEEAM